MRPSRILGVLIVVLVSLGMFTMAMADDGGVDGNTNPFEYWTPERVASAVPRDLVIDHRGLGYLRSADGGLEPYGHSVAAAAQPIHSFPVEGALSVPRGDPGASTVAAPVIESMSPDGDTIGASHTFTVRVSSPSGIKRVTAYVAPATSATFQRFQMSYVGSDPGSEIWQLNLQGFTDGAWHWYIEVRDNGPRGGNRTTSPLVPFSVVTSGGGGGSTVTHERWTGGGAVQTAAGRILFRMSGVDYVCSGTAVTDSTSGRSIILTAAHCVYDDIAKVFASNAIFIPSQDDGGGDRTDFDCLNDPFGCWSVDHGVVDVNWTTRVFPNNIAWDYSYYVVSDSGAHSGSSANEALDVAVGTLAADFTMPATGATTTAFGYSYSNDPDFMYCQEPMGTNGPANYWLDSCDLSGGSSGGPWLQPLDNGSGPVISLNSWGYTTRSGMAGPKLHDNSAQLLFDVATFSDIASADRGFVVDPNDPPTPPTTTTTTTTTTLPDGITLIVDNYKYRGEKVANLTWNGAIGGLVDVYRDAVLVVMTDNDGYYEDWTGMKGGGFNSWQVCESGPTSSCSEVITVGW
ncbi:MAG: hypothetical protein IH941_03435 [Acidobacteria bacterium]|nr:hypothetical protein [Acidobacteriota bacterium]